MDESALFIVITTGIIWELSWKAISLWRAAEEEESGWMIAALFLPSFGIIPIIYLITSTDHSDIYKGSGYKDLMT